ncbi:MAG: helix-turn-helix domain-containing protein, partial [Pseudomonas putida]
QLAERLLARHAVKMKHAPVRLSPQARACLQSYAWPGNVRELDNALQRALILQQGGVIEAADFCLAGAIPLSAGIEPSPEVAAEASGLGDDMRRHEYQMIIDTLRAERGRRKEAAERLGISPRTLRYKLAQMRDAGFDVEASLFG